MTQVLPKHAMSEEDIKLQFITPAITAKWDIRKITNVKQTLAELVWMESFRYKKRPLLQ